MQVFKGIKNGVQEVAVKVLLNSDEIQVQAFQEVRRHAETPTVFTTAHARVRGVVSAAVVQPLSHAPSFLCEVC